MEQVYRARALAPGEAAVHERPREGAGRPRALAAGAARRARQPAPRRRLLGRALREGRAVPAAAGGSCSAATRFDAFLRGYFDAHAFRSITTDEFVAYLKQRPAGQRSRQGRQPRSRPLAEQARAAARRARARTAPAWRWWTASGSASWPGTPARQLDTRGWVTQQWQHFIQGLPADVSTARLAELDARLRLHRQRQQRDPVPTGWCWPSSAGYRPADARLEEFLLNVGRRKFLKPLYTELAKTEAGTAAGAGHLRQGASALPRGGDGNDRQDPRLALRQR